MAGNGREAEEGAVAGSACRTGLRTEVGRGAREVVFVKKNVIMR